MTRTVLFDDVFFGIAQTGIARYWENVLKCLKSTINNSKSEIQVVILDRTNKVSGLGFPTTPFPAYDKWQPASDRINLIDICSSQNVDLFVSSYYTFVPGIKNLLPVYDLIPEEMGFSRLNKTWLERELALHYADHFLSISDSTSNDLARVYKKDKERIWLAKPGVDRQVFNNLKSEHETTFPEKRGLNEYIVFVGSRKDYKNGRLLLEFIEKNQDTSLQFVFVGGGPPGKDELKLARNVPGKLFFFDLDDAEYSECIKSALCLVYPSLYEGFGLPILEALSCGTPVIALDNSSIREAGGDLVLYMKHNTLEELRTSIYRAEQKSWRDLVDKLGPIRAESMSWQTTADNVLTAIEEALNSDHWNQQKESLFEKQTNWSYLTNL